MSKQEEFIKNRLKEMLPQRVVLNYFQHWGQSKQERINVLQEIADAIGFKVKLELISDDSEVGVTCNDERSRELWPQFFQDLKRCWPRGQFEDEERAVRKLIEKYQELILAPS